MQELITTNFLRNLITGASGFYTSKRVLYIVADPTYTSSGVNFWDLKFSIDAIERAAAQCKEFFTQISDENDVEKRKELISQGLIMFKENLLSYTS